MLETESVTGKLLRSSELHQQMIKALVLSSWQMGWNGISVKEYQYPTTSGEIELPGVSDHWSHRDNPKVNSPTSVPN
jgi:hypothetical protein